MQEFRFLRDAVVKERPPMEDNMPDRHDPERDGDGQAFFRQYARDGSSPFDVQPCHFDDEDVFSGSRVGFLGSMVVFCDFCLMVVSFSLLTLNFFICVS